MVKIQEIKQKDKKGNSQSKYVITLPSNIVKMKDLKKGDNVVFKEEEGRYYIDFIKNE